MIKPEVVGPGEEVHVVGEIFGTPLVTKEQELNNVLIWVDKKWCRK